MGYLFGAVIENTTGSERYSCRVCMWRCLLPKKPILQAAHCL